ncbi:MULTISPECIES: type II secretion system F family protein [unclassified Vibrio]|uniref:type II secretion system F family protein n=1 Tax=unclassified Vibrio TaxID=2614977 RepID=UPI0013613086|nr:MULTISPECIES: type II secretion system F family protein [unclassified Vibrio]NAW56496.1 type II secretion system F family protein [Vibrio sp. V36_P2S2PM302]NAX25779.1 type II secretion system F family protein [Vibrio sp. V38_P2S17PM301]NAX32302.1 type II secretion system F family protein [Vibrio sp. V37_P2S8PM304]
MDTTKILIWVVVFGVSMGLAALVMRFYDNTRANIATRKIIGSTREERKRTDLLKSLISRVSFNKDETKKKLVSAGIYSDFLADSYYLFKIIPFGVSLVFIVFSYLQESMGITLALAYLMGALIAFIVLPDTYVASRGKANIKRISARLPFLLDLMNVCVHTGMTIESSLDYLSKELQTVDRNLAYVVRVTVERARLVGIEKALEEFYELVPTSESQSFVMTLVQSLQFGSSIGPVLATLATDIREINMMELEEKIGKMGAKMSIPLIAFIMVPIVVLIAAPGIMRMLMQ